MEVPENIDTHILDCEFPATDMSALYSVVQSDDTKQRLEEELENLSISLSEAGGDDEDLIKEIDEV